VELRGPARPDYQWQARARNGYALTDFHLDWEGERATCPAGHTGSSWRQRPDPAGRDLIWVTCSSTDCGPCLSRPQCCRAQVRSPRRTRCLRPRAQFEALAGGPPTRDDRCLRRALRRPRRDRGHARSRDPPLPPPAHALSRATEGPPRSHPHRDQPQLPPPWRVVCRDATVSAPALALRPLAGGTAGRVRKLRGGTITFASRYRSGITSRGDHVNRATSQPSRSPRAAAAAARGWMSASTPIQRPAAVNAKARLISASIT